MFLQPKKTKYRKIKKGRLRNFDFKNTKIKFGEVGLKSKMSGTLSARQLEATRRAIVKKLQKKGKLWTKVFPSTPITNKPSESRMGKGKGTVSFWGIRVAKGCVLFEICGVPLKTAREAFLAGSHKLPVKTKIIYQ